MNSRKPIATLILFTALSLHGAAAIAESDPYRIDETGEVIDDRVMYRIGGGSVASAPSSVHKPGSIGVGVSWKTNMMCGKFDLSATIKNQLNGITDGFKDLMGNVIQAATGAVASLPAMIIQRANPGLYELLSNGVLQGRIDFDRSKLTCEQLAKKMADVVTGSEWDEIASAQSLQDLLDSPGKDAVSVIKKHENEKGENGVAWMGGKRAGGKGQEPIRVTSDVVKVGYNALHKKGETSTAGVSGTECKGGGVCSAWSSPKEAAEWAVRVLGESERRTCQDCEPISSTAGVGLTPLIQEEYEERIKLLEQLIRGSAPTTAENLKKVSSSMLPVSRRVVEALRDDPDQEILARRLASETAMSSVLQKALMLHRTLLAGARNPNVEQAKPAQEGTQSNVDALLAEIRSLQMEMDVRQSLATNTATAILTRQEGGFGTSKGSQVTDPDRARIEKIKKAPKK